MEVYMGVITSLDKIKLVCKIPLSVSLDSFLMSCHTCSFCGSYSLKDSFDSLNKFKYCHSFVFVPRDLDEGTVFLSVGYNGGINGNYQARQFLLEFNPSKNGKYFVDCLFNFIQFYVIRILSFDVAFDVPGVSVSQTWLDVKNEHLMSFGSSLVRTWYVSPKNRNGRVKVYQKDVERSLVGEAIEQTLRIEITVECSRVIYGKVNDALIGDLMFYVNRLNMVKWFDFDVPELLLLVNVSEDIRLKYLSLLSVNSRTKYKRLLRQSAFSLELDFFSFAVTVVDLLSEYSLGGKYCYESNILGLP